MRSGNILTQGMCHLRQNTIVRTLKGIALPIIRAELSTALHWVVYINLYNIVPNTVCVYERMP